MAVAVFINEDAIVTDVNELQFANIPIPNCCVVVIPRPTVTLVTFAQFANALTPNRFTFSGITIELTRLQSANAVSPILVKPVPNSIVVAFLQFLNELTPIVFRLSGKIIEEIETQFKNAIFEINVND